jgi:hypothetical protein
MSSVEVPNSFCMVGMATLTMLVSSTVMNIPTTTTASGRPQCAAGAVGVAGGGVLGSRAGAVGRCATDAREVELAMTER